MATNTKFVHPEQRKGEVFLRNVTSAVQMRSGGMFGPIFMHTIIHEDGFHLNLVGIQKYWKTARLGFTAYYSDGKPIPTGQLVGYAPVFVSAKEYKAKTKNVPFFRDAEEIVTKLLAKPKKKKPAKKRISHKKKK